MKVKMQVVDYLSVQIVLEVSLWILFNQDFTSGKLLLQLGGQKGSQEELGQDN